MKITDEFRNTVSHRFIPYIKFESTITRTHRFEKDNAK